MNGPKHWLSAISAAGGVAGPDPAVCCACGRVYFLREFQTSDEIEQHIREGNEKEEGGSPE